MGMNHRLLRPRQSGDKDALRYIDAVEAADQQSLEPAVRMAISAFVVGCKANGIWPSIKSSCILAGARTLAGALVPLVGTAPTNVNNNFVSGDYNRKTGLVGNGTTKYLNSGRSNSADPQDNQHMAVYVATAATSGINAFPVYIGGGANATGSAHFGRLNSNGNLFFRNRNGSAVTAGSGSGNATGFLGASRSSSADYVTRISGTNGTVTQASESALAQNVFVFAASADSGSGTASNTISNARLAFYSIGESLDLAQLDARVSALMTAIGNAIL